MTISRRLQLSTAFGTPSLLAMAEENRISRRVLLKGSLVGTGLLHLTKTAGILAEPNSKADLLPFRHIHLDFHTSPTITGVGEDFKAAEFVRILKEASVNSITIYAKCHHGMAYYPTNVGVRHPNLGFDLLGQMMEACHREGFRVCVFISTMYDQYAWLHHGDWRALNPDGEEQGHRGNAGPVKPTLGRVCVNTGYLEYLAAMAEEVLTSYEADGIFYDNFGYGSSQSCSCASCMLERGNLGLDSRVPEDRVKHAHMVMERAMARLASIARAKRPKGTIFINGPLTLRQDPEFLWSALKYYTHIEIESLPGGFWGYSYFPLAAQRLRNCGLDTMGMTGAFHRSWGDFGTVRSQAALDYECFRMLAQATKCAIGDHLHPRGKLVNTTYERIGRTYRSVAEKEPWCRGAKPITEIGCLITWNGLHGDDSDSGLAAMLTQLRQQFDLLDPAMDFSRYKVLILPDSHRFDETLQQKLEHYVAGGGRLILSHESGLDMEGKQFVLPVGAEYESPWKHEAQYIEVLDAELHELPAMVEIAYENGSAVKAARRATLLARCWRAYFDKDYKHFQVEQTPYSEPTEYAAVVATGDVIYIAIPIFRSYAHYGYPFYRDLVGNCLRRLLPEPLVKAEGPTTMQATVTEQPTRHIVHLLNYMPERRTSELDIVEDVIPLENVKLALRLDQRPRKVYLAPQRQELRFEYGGGYAQTVVPALTGHQMVIFEHS